MPRSKHLAALLVALTALIGSSGPAYCDLSEFSRIVFASDRDGNSEIYSMWADPNSPQTNLTNYAGAEDRQPKWSPDGLKIMFDSTRAGKRSIYTLNLADSSTTRITNNTTYDDFFPDLSHDGTTFLFVSNRDNVYGEVFRAPVANPSAQTKIPGFQWYNSDPTWKPDGTKIAWAPWLDDGKQRDIWLMNPDGSNQIRLTYRPEDDTAPAWSPDGKKIAFTSYNGQGHSIWLMNADGSSVVPLTTQSNFLDARYPSYSPDGKKIAFSARSQTHPDNYQIYVMNADGSNPTRATVGAGNDSWPAWSPVVGKVITGLPNYTWTGGCAPTAGGNLLEYWDRRPGHSRVLPGNYSLQDTNNPPHYLGEYGRDHHWEATDAYNADAMSQLIASTGHHQDFWSPDSPENVWTDPMASGRAGWNSIADYMGSSKAWTSGVPLPLRLHNGDTCRFFVGPGLADAVRAFGGELFTFSLTDVGHGGHGTFTFTDLQKEIDKSPDPSPVILHIIVKETDAQGKLYKAGHDVVAYGYQDGPEDDDWVAVRDGWGGAPASARSMGIPTKEESGHIWWKWVYDRTQTYYIDAVTRFWPAAVSGERHSLQAATFTTDESLAEAFRISNPGGSGSAAVVGSTLDPGESVLKLTVGENDTIALSSLISPEQVLELCFDYLFDTPGKVEIRLDGTVLDTLLAPTSGSGSPGSAEFGHFSEEYDLLGIGFDGTHELVLTLSGQTDPILYMDNFWTSTVVPEPCTIAMLFGALLLLSSSRMRRRSLGTGNTGNRE